MSFHATVIVFLQDIGNEILRSFNKIASVPKGLNSLLKFRAAKDPTFDSAVTMIVH